MVGMTRESINKQLRAWAARGWVRLEHGAIVVLKAEPLQALIEAGPDDEGDSGRWLAGIRRGRRLSQDGERGQGL